MSRSFSGWGNLRTTPARRSSIPMWHYRCGPELLLAIQLCGFTDIVDTFFVALALRVTPRQRAKYVGAAFLFLLKNSSRAAPVLGLRAEQSRQRADQRSTVRQRRQSYRALRSGPPGLSPMCWRSSPGPACRKPGPKTQMNIMESSLMAGFDICLQQAGILTDDALSSSQIVVRDTMALACRWGAGDKTAAFAIRKTRSSKAALLQVEVWDFTGSPRFLSNRPLLLDRPVHQRPKRRRQRPERGSATIAATPQRYNSLSVQR
jgi:hypothetical protein